MTSPRIAEQAPEHVQRLSPYVPGKPIDELAREYGLAEDDIVKLASNENPRGPSAKAKQAIVDAAAGVTRYPDGNGFALKNALAARFGVTQEQVVLGNGSNDILELATQAFLRPGDEAVYSQHAFAVYPLATQARGANGIAVPARDLGHDLPAMRAATERRARASCSSPIPTIRREHGLRRRRFDRSSLRYHRRCWSCSTRRTTNISSLRSRRNSASWLAAHPNLLISRTFSKAYGLAGLRIGYGLADASVANMLNRVRQPFNVNSVAQAAAIAALADTEYVAESARLNRAGLAQLTRALDAMGVTYVPSHANFLLVHVGDAASIYDALLRQGVIVRPVANYGLPEHLRVSVGLPAENAALSRRIAGCAGTLTACLRRRSPSSSSSASA